jgi:AAHS family 4-hydroxybenzoate transporter-like MFS transporter
VAQIFFFCAIPAVIAALLIIQVRSPTDTAQSPVGASLLAKNDNAV